MMDLQLPKPVLGIKLVEILKTAAKQCGFEIKCDKTDAKGFSDYSARTNFVPIFEYPDFVMSFQKIKFDVKYFAVHYTAQMDSIDKLKNIDFDNESWGKKDHDEFVGKIIEYAVK